MNTNPLVSVVMAVRHNEQYIAEAIQSILNQSYKHFEFIIVSSFGSHKESVDIIDSFRDPRIRHVHAESSRSLLPMVINQGLNLAKGKYVARMDSDDISLPHRLETEVTFMENHPDIAIAGSYAKTFGKKNIFMRNPTKPEDIKAHILFHMSFVNPTVIIRTETLQKEGLLRYDENLKYCEDLDFFVRVARKICLANIPAVLLHYRTHDTQATHQEKDYQSGIRDAIFQTQLDQFGVPAGDKKRAVYRSIRTFREEDASAEFLSTAEAWFQDLASMNLSRGIYEQNALKGVLANEWFTLCRLSTKKLGATTWRIFWRSEIRRWLKNEPRTVVRVIKFLFKTRLNK